MHLLRIFEVILRDYPGCPFWLDAPLPPRDSDSQLSEDEINRNLHFSSRFPLSLSQAAKLLISEMQFLGTFSPGPVFWLGQSANSAPPEKLDTGKLAPLSGFHKHLSDLHTQAALFHCIHHLRLPRCGCFRTIPIVQYA